MQNQIANVWPPVYDFEQLEKQIKDRVGSGEIHTSFYEPTFDRSFFCQGDTLSLKCDFPFIDEHSNISIFGNQVDFWLVLGNTCDLERGISEVPYTQIIPLSEVRSDDPDDVKDHLKKYKAYRSFFVPCWEAREGVEGYRADLTNICTIHKSCLTKNCQIKARMQVLSWLIYHSCLVRYFARGDGRNN